MVIVDSLKLELWERGDENRVAGRRQIDTNLVRRRRGLTAMSTPFPSGNRADQEGCHLIDSIDTSVVRSVELRGDQLDRSAKARKVRHVGDDVLSEGIPSCAHEESAVPAVGLGNDLDERANGRIHQPHEIIGRAFYLQGVEQRMPSNVDLAHSVREDRRHQAGPIAEVVLRRRVIALAGGSGDVTQRDRLDAAFGEQLLCHLECETGRIPTWSDRSTTYVNCPTKSIVLLSQLSDPATPRVRHHTEGLADVPAYHFKMPPDSVQPDLVVTRIVAASPDQIWVAWHDPAAIARWWGPHGFTSMRELDVNAGGRFDIVMRGPDGAEFSNVYLFESVEPFRRIVFIHQGSEEHGLAPSRSVMSIDEVDVGTPRTQVTLCAFYASDADRRRHLDDFQAAAGAHQLLERLESVALTG